MSYKTINPATGKQVEVYKELTGREIEEKLEKAASAYKQWKKFAFSVRSKHIKEVGELLKEKKQEYAELITLEMGKPIKQSISEVEKCAWVCEYYADNAKMFLKDEHIKTESQQSFISYEPLGVILAIMPWNFPFWQTFRFAAPALMAGNVGVLKHASNVPKCAMAIEQLFIDAGCGEGVFQNLLVSSSNVKKLIENKHVQAVTLTGSEGAGSKVGEQAGRQIKKTVLELGGSDPFIILKEANLKEAAKVAVQSRMINTGQSCIAAKRFIVEESVAESFIALLGKEIDKLNIGDPNDENADLGPMAREDLLKDVHNQVRVSVKKGAKLIKGGERLKRKGYYYKPTLLQNVHPGMPAFDEELFGPVMAVITAKDEEEAISLANNSKYGLGASLWTENMDLAARLVRNIQAGNVFVNSMVKSDPRLPFGGIKKSGYGRELSDVGIKEFVNIKSIVINN